LDEDFTPILTEAATGLQRPTAWLSGGEESAVSLALRIAIGEVVSGQHAGLLVLDEVLTAQDPARRASVMSAIRALNARQVITINHVSEATDMVDLVTYVVPSPDGGSTLELSSEDSAEDIIVSEENLDEEG
jgi:exonuclease SbcC